MLKDKGQGSRSVYEEILEQQYGGKSKKQAGKPAKPAKNLASGSEILIRQPEKTKAARVQEEDNKFELKGSLAREERLIIQRVFIHYSENKEQGAEPLLRLNKFKRLIHDTRIPVSTTAIELIFYGENRHQ